MDTILEPIIGDRKVGTPEELRAAVEASRLRHPTIKVWIAEGLEEKAWAVWIKHLEGPTEPSSEP